MSAGPGQHHWRPGRTALYRLYDFVGALLYIGITDDPDARNHESVQPWWPQVDRERTTAEWFDTRKEADAAETEAIGAEHPLHNVAKSPWAPKPRELGTGEISVAELRNNLTEAINRVRLLGELLVIVDRTRARKPQAALVPFELAEAAEAAGGMDAATAILRKSIK